MKARAKRASARLSACALAAGGLIVAFPALAFASDEAESGSRGILEIIPSTPTDMLEFIPMLICFIVLCIILGKLGWPKFAAMIDKRAMTIKESLEKSEAARIESERLLQEYKEQLEEAKVQAAQIIADAKKTGEALSQEMSDRAQSEAANIITKAKLAIEIEKKSAIAELQSSVADTSVELASRLIGENLSDDEHRKIVENYVNEAGSFNAN